MSNSETFAQNKAIGKIGEAQVQDYYLRAKKIILQDVRDDDTYKAIDVDFIVPPYNLWLETKTDRDYRPSILAEITENETTQTNSRKNGWIYTTHADIIAYYQMRQAILLMLDCQRLRKHIIRQIAKGTATIIVPNAYPDTCSARLTWQEITAAHILISAHQHARGAWHDLSHDDLMTLAAWSDF